MGGECWLPRFLEEVYRRGGIVHSGKTAPLLESITQPMPFICSVAPLMNFSWVHLFRDQGKLSWQVPATCNQLPDG
ncbi:MAG: hypothetical protein DMG41_12585 [Acidobacteria bacterium]|nr:MAG: hypothetical protein AUH13_06120 [Acidobacteria bacterium 13_2_20CM_58_27]PYT73048.1 MAG: hypothetical protein DMG42_13370 [Acidobacteriota bacterium]PYT88183.1 MAG: hypothetical protein DMG41_12585 [Acidobacteriota bacterium]